MKPLPSILRPAYHFLAYHLFYRDRLKRTVTTSLNGFELVIQPSVMHPRIFKSGKIFAQYLSTLDFRGKRVLDLGTGSGILALAAAGRGATVTASDINPLAVRCASENVRRNGFAAAVEVLEGPLFAPHTHEAFDIIIFNPPYFDERRQVSHDPALYGGRNLSLIEELSREAVEFLKPGGYLLLILSSDSDIGRILGMFSDSPLSPQLVHQEQTLFEEFSIYKFTPSNAMESILVCPSCRGILLASQGGWECKIESLSFGANNGIPDFVLPSRRAILDQFLETYQSVRREERWGNKDPRYYHELPYRDLSDEHSGIWAVRARSYDCLIEHLTKDVPGQSQRILDLGAGNCWLSVRLSRLGYNVVAVDVNTDSDDGLGVARRLYDFGEAEFNLLRAEFKFMPFSDNSFDAIIFNASLHYEIDPYETIMGMMPLLKHTGCIYILDSPIYSNRESGEAMVRERIESLSEYPTRVITRESAGCFLTYGGLDQLRENYIVDVFFPPYGILWNLRPYLSRLLGRRQPASFALIRIRNREAAGNT